MNGGKMITKLKVAYSENLNDFLNDNLDPEKRNQAFNNLKNIEYELKKHGQRILIKVTTQDE